MLNILNLMSKFGAIIWRSILFQGRKLEKNIGGRILILLIVGTILMVLAAIYVTPGHDYRFHGYQYYLLSIDPFNFSVHNDMQFRILTPLFGHILNLRGMNLYWVTRFAGVLFLGSIYYFLRYTKKLDELSSIGIATMMALSIPVTIILHYPGFHETVSFLFLWLAIMARRKIWLWSSLLLLALMDHERNIFIFPAILFFFMVENRWQKYSRYLLGMGVSIVAFLLLHDYMTMLGASSGLTFSFYLQWGNILANLKDIQAFVLLGIWHSFRLFWFFPIYAIYVLISEKKTRFKAIFFVLIIGGAGTQLLFAHDTTRLMGLAFPAVIFGALEVRAIWGAKAFRRRLWAMVFLSLLLPNVMVFKGIVIPFLPLPITIAYDHLIENGAWNRWRW